MSMTATETTMNWPYAFVSHFIYWPRFGELLLTREGDAHESHTSGGVRMGKPPCASTVSNRKQGNIAYKALGGDKETRHTQPASSRQTNLIHQAMRSENLNRSTFELGHVTETCLIRPPCVWHSIFISYLGRQSSTYFWRRDNALMKASIGKSYGNIPISHQMFVTEPV